MISNSRRLLTATALLATSMTLGANSDAERSERAEKGAAANQGSAAAASPTSAGGAEEVTAQDIELRGYIGEFSREIAQTIEKWLASGQLTEERLFSRLYYPIANTDPMKYNTDYDSLADRDFPGILEKYLSKSSTFLFAIATDVNAYAPTHNRQFSQPLSGNVALDFANNRAKRFFGDSTGITGARNMKPFLNQVYQRDTGELAEDISAPVLIRGKHWGCVRIGYRRVAK